MHFCERRQMFWERTKFLGEHFHGVSLINCNVRHYRQNYCFIHILKVFIEGFVHLSFTLFLQNVNNYFFIYFIFFAKGKCFVKRHNDFWGKQYCKRTKMFCERTQFLGEHFYWVSLINYILRQNHCFSHTGHFWGFGLFGFSYVVFD